MSRTITTTVYPYAELSEAAKAAAREAFRTSGYVDSDDWSQNVIEDAKGCLATLGFTVTAVYWSGFACQGDGASFVGTWTPAHVSPQATRAHAPLDTTLHTLADALGALALAHPQTSAQLTSRDRYCHEYTIAFDIEAPTEFDDVAVSAALPDLARSAMRWIYANLSRAYDDAQSDESVTESIEANAIEFTDKGRIYS